MSDIIVNKIRERINELKYEQVNLRMFIESDRARKEALQKAIFELELVIEMINARKDEVDA